MKPKRRILSLLLAICLVVGIMPTAAFAANNDKAIQLGASNISGYDSTNGYDYIYYGEWDNSPIKWRVLDEQTNTQNEGLFLLSDVLLGTGTYGGVYFDSTSPYGNAWQGSDAQDWCETFYNDSLTTQEQSAVLETTKSDGAFTSSTYRVPFAASENILNGDKVFFLSAEEAENSAYGFTDDNARIANYGNSAGVWLLRSPYAYYTLGAGAVSRNGRVDYVNVYNAWAARPAFNLNRNSVLFTSAAEGGKIPAANGGGNQGGEAADAIFEIPTTDARTGANEYISAVIEDGGVITHYGRILQPTSESGTASLSLPSGVTLSDTTELYVFNEQYNGDYKTDYASELKNISPAPVPNPDPNPNPNPNPNYNQRPVIIIPTTDQNVSASVGNTVTMRITANYAQSYQWYVDTGSGFKAIPGATGAAYTTSQVALGNNGYRYYCVARNAYGTAVSPVFTLNVLEYMGIPATGDSAQAGLWIGLMMIALAGLAACAVLYRKRKQER